MAHKDYGSCSDMSSCAYFCNSSTPCVHYFSINEDALYGYGNDKGLRGHSKKICKPRFKTDTRKYFFLKSSL